MPTRFHGAAIHAAELAGLLEDGEEILLLDAREEGVFAAGHLLLAANLPTSRLELDLAWRVPRLDTRIVIVNAFNVRRVAATLGQQGYTQVAWLDGGQDAWVGAGYQVFSGLYVPSKAFGEVVEHTANTPRMTADEMRAMQDAGVPVWILDSRPLEEFREFSIPGGVNCPGAELVARVSAGGAIPAGATLVVNCAGRTRSIIGAQSLIHAGVPFKVVALENGTMGWHLSGHVMARGAARSLPVTSVDESVRDAAHALAERAGAKRLSWDDLLAFRRDASRTTYCYDVRQATAYLAGHLPGFRHAAGGQLVQSTDVYAPVRGARIVVTDTDAVQAPMTAQWLAQMGWETYVLDRSDAPAANVVGPAPTLQLTPRAGQPLPSHANAIEVCALQDAIRNGAAIVIDCGDSRAYRRRRIPGASFATRAYLTANPGALHSADVHAPLESLVAPPQQVIVSEDGAVARLAANDLVALGIDAVYLEGGMQAWIAADGDLEHGEGRYIGSADDAWYSPYQVPPLQMADAMRDYIEWETGLLHAIHTEPGLHFHPL